MIKKYEQMYIRSLVNITKNLTNGLRCKHAAMLLNKNKIINIGVNKTKSDPLQKQFTRLPQMSWLHAEIGAIKNFEWMDLRKATLIVVRSDAQGTLMESCPCAGCMRLIEKMKIPRIIHSNNYGKLTEIIKEY